MAGEPSGTGRQDSQGLLPPPPLLDLRGPHLGLSTGKCLHLTEPGQSASSWSGGDILQGALGPQSLGSNTANMWFIKNKKQNKTKTTNQNPPNPGASGAPPPWLEWRQGRFGAQLAGGTGVGREEAC